MFDGLVRIVDRLIELRKYREERNLRLFNSSVKKIYEDMREVHADYLVIFKSCEDALNKNTPLREIADTITSERLRYEPTRVQIKAMLWELVDKPELASYKELLTGLISYFSLIEGLTRPGTPSAALLDLLEAAESNSLGDIEGQFNEKKQETVRKTVSAHLQLLRDRWNELSRLYAKAYSKAL